MSFLAQPQITPGIVQAFVGPNSLAYGTNYAGLISSMPQIALGRSLLANVETLIYDSIGPCYLYNLLYGCTGIDLQNTRIRISDNDSANFINLVGMTPGVAGRGDYIIGAPNGNVAFPVTFRRMKVYVTTQFTDAQADLIFFGNMIRVSS